MMLWDFLLLPGRGYPLHCVASRVVLIAGFLPPLRYGTNPAFPGTLDPTPLRGGQRTCQK